MKLTRTSFLMIALLVSVANVCAQDRAKLEGKVALANPRESTSEILIRVRDRDTDKLIGGEQSSTKSEDWFHFATLNALVDVEFDGGVCYVLDGYSAIRVKQVNEELKKITLQKTRECKLKESRQRRAYQIAARTGGEVNGVATNQGGATVGAIVDERMEARAKIDRAIETEVDEWLVPSPEQLKQELESEAAHARNGGFFDTFQYKFSLKEELYRSHPELVQVLTDFKNKKENAVLFGTIGQIRPEMFTDVVRRELQKSNEVNLDNVWTVFKEESASPSVRGTANVAYLNGLLPDERLKQAIAYYRQQAPDSPIFATSLIALGRVGEPEDQARLYSYVNDSSGETRWTAMEALSLTTIIKGPVALPDASKTLAKVASDNTDPYVRAFAYHSLRPFVYHGDAVAFRALLKGAHDQNAQVRLQAVLALGVGRTEQKRRVHTVLRTIYFTDRSSAVRQAAKLSLIGATTRNLAAIKLAPIDKN